MGKKIFVFDFARCSGCHNCQVACKDEHCGQEWAPYAKAQPQTGQFWCKVTQETHGSVPKVNVTYQVNIGAQTEALRAYAPEVLMEREDGIIVIDPAKAAGRKDIAEKFEGVYWNEELQIPQGCTGCAHLLDDGWAAPRCVDSCGVEALRFGDEEDFADVLANAVPAAEGSHLYYLNLPKRWVAGEVYDEEADEVIIGATITIQGEDGVVLKTQSDDFGDFWFKQVEAQKYSVWFEAEGYLTRTATIDATEKDGHIGSIALYKA